MVRAPITPKRMLGEANQVKIIYPSDAIHPRHQANLRVFDARDFPAKVSAHIPHAYEKISLFYGWYSNRTRIYRKRHGLLCEWSPVLKDSAVSSHISGTTLRL